MRKIREYQPITASPQEIDARGLMVFDDIRRMPSYGEPFSTSFMTIGLNLEGWVRVECDTRPVTFQPHDIAILAPNHVICTRDSSDDYRVMLIVLSPAFREEMQRRYPDIYHDNFNYRFQQSLHLENNQFTVIHQLFHLFLSVSHSDSPRRWDMLGDLLEVLFLLLQDYRKVNGAPIPIPSLHEEMFAQFNEAIVKHWRKSREVKFYADMFHLSPKHFSSVIKQRTGRNALDWINGYAAIKARMMLRYHPEMTVSQMAQYMGFLDQASFSRFFKRYVGMSPTEFRRQA